MAFVSTVNLNVSTFGHELMRWLGVRPQARIDPLYLGCRSIGPMDAGSERIARGQTDTIAIGQAPESVNHELIFLQFRRLATRDSVYDVFVARKMQVHTDAEFE